MLARAAAAVAAVAIAAVVAPLPILAQGPPRRPPPPASAPQLRPSAVAQLQVLMAEKRQRTPAQQKMDSNLVYALLRQRQDPRMGALTRLRVAGPDRDGTVLLDVKAFSPAGVKPILARLRGLGARVVSVQLRYASIRAGLRLADAETVAAMPEVRFVQPASRAIVQHLDSEGDATHRAAAARAFFGADGTGVKICVLSDGVDSLAEMQSEGNLPPGVDVLPGQAGAGDEGTAILEIVHDLAPGAALGFATVNPDEATFAQNILDLRNVAHCDVIVDDVIYLSESPFQDLIIADAVNQVTAAGALYFSSANNEGNLDAGTSGTWEGDFKANGNLDPVLGSGAGSTHDFGDGGKSDLLTADTLHGIVLHWTDPAGGSCNDYDLYVLDNSLSTVVEASTNVQSCTQDPIELVGNAFAGERVVVVQFSGADRMFNVQAFEGQLQLATAGCTRGHGSAAAAFSMAAAPAAHGLGGPSPNGPFPNPFDATQQPEPFTCDGPRRIFFDVSGNLLPGAPAGNFSASGGVVRQKPDLTAADGVTTDVNNFRPFFGTSAAAAHGAAIAGLLRSALPSPTPAQVRSALTGSAIDVLAPGWDRDTGFGIVMAYPALQAAGAQPQAVMQLGTVTASPAVPSGAAIDPGGDWQLAIVLHNAGGAAAHVVQATLATATPGVGFTNASSPYPDIAAGGSAANSLAFRFTPYNVACGQVMRFTLTVTLAGGPSPVTLPFTIPTGHPGAPVTASYTGPAVPIPDGGNPPGALNEFPGTPAVVPLTVAGVSGRLQKLVFSLDGTVCTTAAGATTVGVDHTFVNDLTFDLQSPAGTTVRVISRADLDGHNFCQVVLDDGTANPSIETVASALAPFTGTWLPNVPLDAFKGEDPNGTWNLTAIDHFGQDTGSVRAFSLVMTPAQCNSVAPLSANLTATKAVTGGSLQPGGTVVYTVTLTNTGNGASFDNPGDEFTDTLPATLTLTSATATLGTVTTSGNTVHWNGGVPAGGQVVITIQATIAAGAVPGTSISNQGTVNYDKTRTGTNQTTLQTSDPSGAGPTQFAVVTASIPTLSGAGLAAMAAALLAAGALALRRRRPDGPGRAGAGAGAGTRSGGSGAAG
jgi:uncharacterized repeat protein (TIGR01451 family)